MKTINCNACHLDKPETEFSLKNKATGRRHTKCKPCQRAYAKAHYRANADEYRERTAARNERVRADYRAVVAEQLRGASCCNCNRPGNAFTRLWHVRKADYHGLPLHQVVREKRGQEALDTALANSEIRCGRCTFEPYHEFIEPFAFGNPERESNIARARLEKAMAA